MVDVVVDGSFPKGRHAVSLSLYRTRPLLKQAKETQQKTQAFLLSIPAHGRGTFVHIVLAYTELGTHVSYLHAHIHTHAHIQYVHTAMIALTNMVLHVTVCLY